MKKTFLSYFLVMLMVLFFEFAFAKEQTNYCKDEKSWDKWEALVQKYPDDEDVQTLHALRIGLCFKIDQGTITFDMAVDLFNRAHEMVIKKKQSEQQKDLKGL